MLGIKIPEEEYMLPSVTVASYYLPKEPGSRGAGYMALWNSEMPWECKPSLSTPISNVLLGIAAILEPSSCLFFFFHMV